MGLTLVFAALLCALAAGQGNIIAKLSLEDGSPAFMALFNPAVAGLEASLGIRFLYIQAIARYEIAAACHPVALSFFGVKDSISPRLCTPTNRAIIRALVLFGINSQQFPIEAGPYGAYLRSIGLSPDSNSNNRGTANGFANFIADRANQYLSNDGWNSQGDTSIPAALRRMYADTTGFVPANKAGTPPDKLPKPLRWQPLEVATGSTGGFRSQTFNTPQLGSAKPLVLSRTAVSGRNSPAPYEEPDRRPLIRKDFLLIQRLLRGFFKTSRDLTVEQRFLARWWENKRISLLSFLPFYKKLLNLDDFQETYIQLAQLLAMHDSIIVGWKEKLKHNAVRPTTAIATFFGNRRIRVFISEQDGDGFILGKDYKPLIPVQAHPEYPSGSALLCTTGLDVLEFALESIISGPIPPYRMTFAPGSFGFPHQQPITVQLNSLRQGAEQCGEARLWAGVHFPPSITAGEELSKGIGLIAFRHVSSLINGTVPRNCIRCL